MGRVGRGAGFAVGELVEAVGRGGGEEEEVAIVEAMGLVGAEAGAAKGTLTGLLDDVGLRLRGGGVGADGGEGGVPKLGGMLAAGDAEVQWAAARAMVLIGGEGARPVVQFLIRRLEVARGGGSCISSRGCWDCSGRCAREALPALGEAQAGLRTGGDGDVGGGAGGGDAVAVRVYGGPGLRPVAVRGLHRADGGAGGWGGGGAGGEDRQGQGGAGAVVGVSSADGRRGGCGRCWSGGGEGRQSGAGGRGGRLGGMGAARSEGRGRRRRWRMEGGGLRIADWARGSKVKGRRGRTAGAGAKIGGCPSLEKTMDAPAFDRGRWSGAGDGGDGIRAEEPAGQVKGGGDKKEMLKDEHAGHGSRRRANPAASVVKKSASEVKVSAEARKELDAITRGVPEADRAGSGGDVVGGTAGRREGEEEQGTFTGSFAAPNKFRHEMKGDVVVGSTGEKLYAFRPAKNDVHGGRTAPRGGCRRRTSAQPDAVDRADAGHRADVRDRG